MTPETLELTPSVWQATLVALAPYRTGRVEGGCLWYGWRNSEHAWAVLVGVPKQINRADHFAIPAEALAELNALIPDAFVVVAQVHTHPGVGTTHSAWDDTMMVSRKLFSLVLPRYAALPCEVGAAGVHIHDGNWWVKLPPEASRGRLKVVDRDVRHDRSARDVTLTLVDAR